jgi:hypothetical protein
MREKRGKRGNYGLTQRERELVKVRKQILVIISFIKLILLKIRVRNVKF